MTPGETGSDYKPSWQFGVRLCGGPACRLPVCPQHPPPPAPRTPGTLCCLLPPGAPYQPCRRRPACPCHVAEGSQHLAETEGRTNKPRGCWGQRACPPVPPCPFWALGAEATPRHTTFRRRCELTKHFLILFISGLKEAWWQLASGRGSSAARGGWVLGPPSQGDAQEAGERSELTRGCPDPFRCVVCEGTAIGVGPWDPDRAAREPFS